jgi:type IV pilus assembly protein PilW
MSIVELMVGVTIGLFILAGATMVASTQLADNRKMLLETQIQQDLRAASDIIGRDLRRAAYWAQSFQRVWPDTGDASGANPYVGLTVSSHSIVYSRSQDERIRGGPGSPVGFDNNVVDGDEQVGFRWNQTNKTVEMLVGTNNWQALTDPNVVEITQFDVTLTTQDLPAPCAEQCPPTGPLGCPLVLQVRDASIVIGAKAVHDPTVLRSVRSDLRLRNDVVIENCP